MNIALQSGLQCKEAAIDREQISITMPEQSLQRHSVSFDVRLAVAQKGNEGKTGMKREPFAKKFFSRFSQILSGEAATEAFGITTEGGTSNVVYWKDKSDLMAFITVHHCGEGMEANNCLTIRDGPPSINTKQKFKHGCVSEMTFSRMHYLDEIGESFVSLLRTEYKCLHCSPGWFAVARVRVDCLHSVAVHEARRHIIFAFENGRSVLFVGEEWSGSSHGGEYSSGMRKKSGAKEPSFWVIYGPETAPSEWLSRLIPIAKARMGGELVMRNNGWLVKGIMKGHHRVIDSIDFAPAKIHERLKTILDANESTRAMHFDIPENKKILTVASSPIFWLIAASISEGPAAMPSAFWRD
jgi:hypothetical protein